MNERLTAGEIDAAEKMAVDSIEALLGEYPREPKHDARAAADIADLRRAFTYLRRLRGLIAEANSPPPEGRYLSDAERREWVRAQNALAAEAKAIRAEDGA